MTMTDYDEMTDEQVKARLAEIRVENAFVGPLPKGLIRDFQTGEVSIGGGHIKDARDFVLAAAALMRHRGRTVEITEEDGSIYAYAPAPRWYDTPVTLHAVKTGQRWKFLGAGTLMRKGDAKTYRAARILVNVYGR